MQESDFWHQVINTISEGLFLVDRQGRISNVNKALCQLTGYTKEEILGKPCSIFQCDTCAPMRDGSVENWCHLFDMEQVSKRRCTIRHKSGEVIPILKNASLLHCDPDDLKKGACDGSLFSVETITDLREILQKEAYITRVEKLLTPSVGFHNMVGVSEVMQRVFRLIEQAAESNAPVFIFGESGTGKELVAQALHNLSNRKNEAFVELNCAALNEQVLESELFGHVKGSFTGATKDRKGRFEAAHGGSLFLDEIGDIQLSTQVKILRVLETGIINKVGSNAPELVNVRIISATNKHLPTLVKKGLFREDLAFRINVIPIHLPPLRKRVEDIPLLIAHFLKTMQEIEGTKTTDVSPALMQAFKIYPWPGNIRELRNLLEYGTAMSDGGSMELKHMPDSFLAYCRRKQRSFQDPSFVEKIDERGTSNSALSSGPLPEVESYMAESANYHRDYPVTAPVSQPGHLADPFTGHPSHPSLVPSHVGQYPYTNPHGVYDGEASSGISEAGAPPASYGIPVDAMGSGQGAQPVNQPHLTAAQQRQKEEILHALATTGGNVSQAAKILKVHRTTVVNRMLRLGMRIQKNIVE